MLSAPIKTLKAPPGPEVARKWQIAWGGCRHAIRRERIVRDATRKSASALWSHGRWLHSLAGARGSPKPLEFRPVKHTTRVGALKESASFEVDGRGCNDRDNIWRLLARRIRYNRH